MIWVVLIMTGFSGYFRTSGQHSLLSFLTARTIRLLGTVVVVFLVLSTYLPGTVIAIALEQKPQLPSLAAFITSVANGEAGVLRGVYADSLFAFAVVQQPAHDNTYVAAADGMLTEFKPASNSGNVGLLAHNYLSGRLFFELQPGQRVVLVYGDGHVEFFIITRVYRFQAVEPRSSSSLFINLASHRSLSSRELFEMIYLGPRHIVFQTCIAANDLTSWGRLFVIGLPESIVASNRRRH